ARANPPRRAGHCRTHQGQTGVPVASPGTTLSRRGSKTVAHGVNPHFTTRRSARGTPLSRRVCPRREAGGGRPGRRRRVTVSHPWQSSCCACLSHILIL